MPKCEQQTSSCPLQLTFSICIYRTEFALRLLIEYFCKVVVTIVVTCRYTVQNVVTSCDYKSEDTRIATLLWHGAML